MFIVIIFIIKVSLFEKTVKTFLITYVEVY